MDGPDETPTKTALPRHSSAPSDSDDEGRFPLGTYAASRWLAIVPFIFYLGLAILITRLGLVAGIAFWSVLILRAAPLTFDFSRWYASYTTAALVLAALLVLFAFKTAMGSRKLFKTDLFED